MQTWKILLKKCSFVVSLRPSESDSKQCKHLSKYLIEPLYLYVAKNVFAFQAFRVKITDDFQFYSNSPNFRHKWNIMNPTLKGFFSVSISARFHEKAINQWNVINLYLQLFCKVGIVTVFMYIMQCRYAIRLLSKILDF